MISRSNVLESSIFCFLFILSMESTWSRSLIALSYIISLDAFFISIFSWFNRSLFFPLRNITAFSTREVYSPLLIPSMHGASHRPIWYLRHALLGSGEPHVLILKVSLKNCRTIVLDRADV